MKIAIVAADLKPERLGGAEAHLVEVAKRLAKKHRLFLFVGEDTKIKKVFEGNVKIFPVRYPKVPNLFGLSYILFGYQQIKNKILNLDVDLIWAKQSFPQAPLAALLKGKLKKPIYVTVQNPLLVKEELVIKGKLLQPLHGLFALLLNPLISWSLSQADMVAAVSSYSAALCKKMGAKKVIVIPNGVDMGKFKTKTSPEDKYLSLLTTSSLIPRNGIDTLIEAVSLLSNEINWKLQIAGEGPEYKKLNSQARRLNIQNRVNFLGRVANKGIPDLLSKADIFIRLSRKEGFGVSFVEAMAAGVPVIATPVGGITDFVKNQKTGLLVEPDNPKQASQAIKRLLTDKKLYSRLQNNGQKLVNNKYNWDKIADEIESIFSSIT